MKKHVILTLEYDMGDYYDYSDKDDNDIPLKPKDWEESFYQSDLFISDMKIIGVRIKEEKDKEEQAGNSQEEATANAQS